MRFQLTRFFISIFCLSITPGLFAASSAYRRAQDLAEEDPREAEALYVHFIAESGNDKLKRAAAHDLFTLRLKQGRLVEAFSQARSSSFRKRFLSAVEEGLKLSAGSARSLVAALRAECRTDGSVEKIADLLEKGKFPVSAYNFALSVLERCKVEEPELVLPEFPEDANKIDARALHLALIEIREAISRDATEEAEDLIAQVRQRAGKLLEKEAGIALHLDFTEARLFSKKEDFAALKSRCADLDKKKPPRGIRNACRFLTAYALLKEEKHAEAYARIVNLKVAATEIDNRLLRLTAAVAAEEATPEKLKKFMKRRSYKECAPVLRRLAESVFAAASENR